MFNSILIVIYKKYNISISKLEKNWDNAKKVLFLEKKKMILKIKNETILWQL